MTIVRFNNIVDKVADYNEYGTARTVAECNKIDRWTPVDLIIREFLNNGAGSAKGFLGITTNECVECYHFAVENKKYLIEKNLVNETAKNNYGFTLWVAYDF